MARETTGEIQDYSIYDYSDIEDLLYKFRYKKGYLYRVISYGKPCDPYIPYTKTNNSGYYSIRINKRCKISVHVAVWVFHNKKWPSTEIDHVNRIKTDNRIKNLRLLSRIKQRQNTKLSITNTSGTRNICFHKGSNSWRVVFMYKGITKTKYFKIKEEAERNIDIIVNPVTDRNNIRVMGDDR